MRSDRDRLHDVAEAITHIEQYAVQGREAFDQSDLIQTWMVHNIEIIGEACRAVSQEFRDAHPEIPWRDIVGMRTLLIHHYFEINTEIVWAAIEKDIPALKERIIRILEQPGS